MFSSNNVPKAFVLVNCITLQYVDECFLPLSPASTYVTSFPFAHVFVAATCIVQNCH